MFLTQKYPIAAISVDGKSDTAIRSEEDNRQNAYVLQEIESVLKDYPEYPYQVAFSIDELRSQLVDHVLYHIPKCYPAVSGTPKSTTGTKFSYRSKPERVRLDVLIRGSIFHLLRENADWISCKLQQLDSSVAKHWRVSDCNDEYGLN